MKNDYVELVNESKTTVKVRRCKESEIFKMLSLIENSKSLSCDIKACRRSYVVPFNYFLLFMLHANSLGSYSVSESFLCPNKSLLCESQRS